MLIAIVVKSQQNTTEALSQDNTTTEVGRTFLTSTQLLTSEEVTTMLPATTMEFNTNDDMSTTSSMTTPLEENDGMIFHCTNSLSVFFSLRLVHLLKDTNIYVTT